MVDGENKKIIKTLLCEGHSVKQTDNVAVEEPLQILINNKNYAVLMRTPGRDIELVAGFLAAEGIVDAKDEIEGIGLCTSPNTVRVSLCAGTVWRPRELPVSSSCGICGLDSIESLNEQLSQQRISTEIELSTKQLFLGLDLLRAHQKNYEVTAGCHGAGLFNPSTNTLLDWAEDIGRHNAVDKIMGKLLLADNYPVCETFILLLSGRISFEIVQKAARGQVAAICAVGMPTSLAIEAAEATGIKLYGWARNNQVSSY